MDYLAALLNLLPSSLRLYPLRKNVDRFVLERILSQNTDRKSIYVLGKLVGGKEAKPAILLLEKTVFKEEDLNPLFDSLDLSGDDVTKILVNDIYSTYVYKSGSDDTSVADVKVTLICPATEAHIIKYSQSAFHLVAESPQLYDKVVLPYISEKALSSSWVDNLLCEEKELPEGEEFYFNDPDKTNGFVVLKDYKWDGVTKENFHVLCLARDPELKSIRDLRAHHVELLERMLNTSFDVIKKRIGQSSSKVKAYFHYPPSFYRLHIHFSSVDLCSSETGIERARLASEVLDNIRSCPDYYSERTLYYTIRETNPICSQLLQQSEETEQNDENM